MLNFVAEILRKFRKMLKQSCIVAPHILRGLVLSSFLTVNSQGLRQEIKGYSSTFLINKNHCLELAIKVNILI